MIGEIDFDYKARYFKAGDIATAKEVWYVLHGYGQLAEYFLKKFNPLLDLNICIIAPEGLSKFYLQGNQGRVGATWMTKENRLMDIENNIRYLNRVHAAETDHRNIPITLFGFSQGAATVMRWAMNKKIRFERMVLWAGLFPPDIDFTKGAALLESKKVIEVLGTQDEFINQQRIAEMHQLNQQLNIQPTIIEFQGKHEIKEDILLRIAKGENQ